MPRRRKPSNPGYGRSRERGGERGREARAMRLRVWEETNAVLAAGEYAAAGTRERVELPRERMDAGVAGTVLRSLHELPPCPRVPGAQLTAVRVVEGDCVLAAFALQDAGRNPVVLNMASRKHPGGGVRNGAGAQEENLFRRSNYCEHLMPRRADFYPMPRDGGSYSPDVLVFRGAEADGYPLLAEPRFVGMMAVPAISNPPLAACGTRLSIESVQATKTKIRLMLRLAAQHGHDAAVLSAFGCGAYRNPPAHVAALFAEVLREREFQECGLVEVVFAIIEDHNSRRGHNPEGNVAPFRQVFGGSDGGAGEAGAGADGSGAGSDD